MRDLGKGTRAVLLLSSSHLMPKMEATILWVVRLTMGGAGRMRLPAAKDVSAAPRSQHGAPDMGACPAPCKKLQNTREGPAASPPGAPPQGSRVRADPGEVPEASPPHPQGQADRPAAACWTAHLGQRAGRQTGPRTRTGCSRNFSTTSASAASSAALTDPILAEHPGLAGASGARPDWASVRPHSSLNISPP